MLSYLERRNGHGGRPRPPGDGGLPGAPVYPNGQSCPPENVILNGAGLPVLFKSRAEAEFSVSGVGALIRLGVVYPVAFLRDGEGEGYDTAMVYGIAFYVGEEIIALSNKAFTVGYVLTSHEKALMASGSSSLVQRLQEGLRLAAVGLADCLSCVQAAMRRQTLS